MLTERPRQLTGLLLGTLFVFGVGTQAYGWHDCPHHHPVDEDPARVAADGPAPHPVAEDAGRSATSTDGPCICVGSCHASATAPHPSTSLSVRAISDVEPPAARPVDSALLPRSVDPYFLPFPNAPPRPSLRATPS